MTLCLLPSLACQDPPKATPQWTPEQIALKKKRLGLAAPSTKPEPPEPTPPPPKALYHPQPPWTSSNALLSELSLSWPDEPRGHLTGELFGTKLPVFGLVRTQCGHGTILQAIYRDPSQGMRTTSPVLWQTLTFPKKRTLSYEESGFLLSAQVLEDTPKRFQGRVRVTSIRTQKPFLDLTYDGPILPMLLPPVLPKGFPLSPTYPECYASGYFSVTTDAPERNRAQGLLHARDARADGSPIVRIPLTDRDVLRIHVHNPTPHTPIQTPRALPLDRARSARAAPRILVDLLHLPLERKDGAEVLRSVREFPLIDGSLWLETKRATSPQGGDLWHFAGSLADIQLPSDIDSPLAGATLQTLSLDAFLIDPNSPRPLMPPRRELNP